MQGLRILCEKGGCSAASQDFRLQDFVYVVGEALGEKPGKIVLEGFGFRAQDPNGSFRK